jgi:hypothetical protein
MPSESPQESQGEGPERSFESFNIPSAPNRWRSGTNDGLTCLAKRITDIENHSRERAERQKKSLNELRDKVLELGRLKSSLDTLDILENKVSELAKDLAVNGLLSTEFENHKAQLASIRQSQEDTGDRVEHLQEVQNSATIENSKLKQEIRNDIIGLTRCWDELKAAIEELQGRVDTGEEGIDEVNEKCEAVRKETEEQAQAQSGQVAAVRKEVQELALAQSGKVEDHDRRIRQLEEIILASQKQKEGVANLAATVTALETDRLHMPPPTPSTPSRRNTSSSSAENAKPASVPRGVIPAREREPSRSAGSRKRQVSTSLPNRDTAAKRSRVPNSRGSDEDESLFVSQTPQPVKGGVGRTPKSEPVRPSRTRAATPAGLSKFQKERYYVIRELKDLKCFDLTKYKPLHDEYLAAPLRFPLFKLEIKHEFFDFFLVTGQEEQVRPCRRTALAVLHNPRDSLIVQDTRIVECLKVHAKSGKPLEDRSLLLLCLGEVYKHSASKKENTGWYVFVDIEHIQKPVYMIFQQELYDDDGRPIKKIPWNHSTFGFEAGSKKCIVRLLPSIYDWPNNPENDNPEHFLIPEDKAAGVLGDNGQEAHVRFTRPLCDELVSRLEAGWKSCVVVPETAALNGGRTNPTNPANN